jgi:hypothetical protein
MTSFSTMRSAVCVTAILSAGTAMADVTAAQVWQDWQDNLAVYGDDTLTIGSETMQGDTLTVSDIVVSTDDDISAFTMAMGDLMFVENGDGTVSVEMAASYPIEISNPDGDTMELAVTQSGQALKVSGTPEQMIYTLSADQYGISLVNVMDDGEKMDVDVRIIANDVAGAYTTTTDDLRHIDSDFTAASIDILVDATPPETPGDYFTFSGKIEGLSSTSSTSMPTGEAASDPEMFMANGFAFAGGMSYQSANYLFDVKAEGEQSSGTGQTGDVTTNASFSSDAVTYNTSVNDLKIAVSGAGIPFPVEVSMAQYGVGFEMPLGKTEEPADFGLKLNLTDLAVNDMIWMLADPTGALPHDPATVLLDLSGKAKLLFDLLDPAQADAMAMTELPGELHALTLNNLSLKLGGAELTGLGDFTFDNSDLDTFDGMPRPAGELNVNLKGGNALVDSLVQMGVIPEDQAMMGRMMMGMFAQSTGDDELTSKIEVNDQGHVIANGQRIK